MGHAEFSDDGFFEKKHAEYSQHVHFTCDYCPPCPVVLVFFLYIYFKSIFLKNIIFYFKLIFF